MKSAATVKDHIKIVRDGKQGADDTETNGQTATAGKYVPPHLRGTATTKSEQQIRLQRALQGFLNKLSESNLESILLEIEKCYSNYPRHGKKHAYTIFLYVFALGLMSSFFLTDVTSSLTELILTSISQKSNLLDSFVILYAVVVGSLYRLIGIDFGKLLKMVTAIFPQIFNTSFCSRLFCSNPYRII
jgi:nucleolar MIF4G domain-containing protein 1